MPPRSTWTASGRWSWKAAVPPWAICRRLSATVFRMPSSARSSFSANRRARSYASSTMTRRSTTKKMRRGAVMAWLRASRDACTANANTAMSMQAVLPDAVGNAMASGQADVASGLSGEEPEAGDSSEGISELSSTRFASAFCQAKGALCQSAVKNSAKSVACSSAVVAGSFTSPIRSRLHRSHGACHPSLPLAAPFRHRSHPSIGRHSPYPRNRPAPTITGPHTGSSKTITA